MRTLRIGCLALVGILSMATPAGAGAAEPASPAVSTEAAGRNLLAKRAVEVAQIREGTEAWRQIMLAPAAVPDSGEAVNGDKKQLVVKAWQSAVAAGFSRESIAADIEAALTAELVSDDLKRWLAFYDTKLGRKIRAAEKPPEQRLSPERELSELQHYRRKLDADPERKRVIEQIASVTNALSSNVDTMVGLSLGTALGAQSAMPDNAPRADTQTIIRLVRAQRPVMQAAIAAALMPTMAKVYRDVSTAELRAYLAELSTPHAQKFTKVALAAFGKAIKQSALSVGTLFARHLTAMRT